MTSLRLRLALSALLTTACTPPATSDAGTDAPPIDAPSTDDAALYDAPIDAPVPDAGVPDRWAHCPASSTFVGDAGWPQPLIVTDDAVYCARFDESRTLREELDAKSMLRVVAGTYRLPRAPTSGAFSLPLCIWQPGVVPLLEGTGTLTHAADTFGSTTYHRSTFEHPLSSGVLSGDVSFPREGAATADVVLDGRPISFFGEEDSFGFRVCPDEGECYNRDARTFDSCTYATVEPTLHHLVLDDGGEEVEVHFDLRIGQSPASTEPGAFTRAHGTFGGTAFDQDVAVDRDDYFRLVYNPEHHHFQRDFAVLFDAPIDGVCGIEVANLEPFDDYTADEAYAVGCDLTRIRELDVVSHTMERPE